MPRLQDLQFSEEMLAVLEQSSGLLCLYWESSLLVSMCLVSGLSFFKACTIGRLSFDVVLELSPVCQNDVPC
jgi:hypothetical protein